MGFHICEFCNGASQGKNRFNHLSSGDVNLTFTNGRAWVMPDMILHYVADHGWQPPQEFVDDVMNGELASSGRVQTRDMSVAQVFQAERVGYLAGSLIIGSVPRGFVERLEALMKQAGSMGNRVQTKGTTVYR